MSERYYYFPYSSNERENIVQILRDYDGEMDELTMKYIARSLVHIYGHFDFAELESICRENDLQTTILAIPWTKERQASNPDTVIVDPNDLKTEMPYLAHVVETTDMLKISVEVFQIPDFDPSQNLQHLSEAGIAVLRPNSPSARLAKARNN